MFEIELKMLHSVGKVEIKNKGHDMVFWRKKKNPEVADQDESDQNLMHPDGEPDMEPPVEYDAEIDKDTQDKIRETDNDIIDDLEITETPDVDNEGGESVEDDHSEEGGWLSRLTTGLSKSSNKISKNIGDLVTKRKLDQKTVDALEDILIEADLGPNVAEKIIAEFKRERFGKDISGQETREALAKTIADILEPVAVPINVKKPEKGPYVILMCGVNGAGKTTSMGKLAYRLHYEDKMSVMMAAGDTFRAAAVEQLNEWAKRVGCICYTKDIGADAAAVAFEAYEKAVEDNIDVLLIDTAGRLQNKTNLMEELQKIVRVLKKHDENLPHAALLVLDATTGQNALSQVETFKEMVDINGLIMTKLDGAAKGGILVALADKFGVPVHKIGVGEGIRDMQRFRAADYARALMGLSR